MAQTNYTPISLYYSTTASAVPTAANLVPGELAINTNDGKLYYEDSSGVVQVLATKGGVGTSSNTQVLYNSSGLVVGSAGLTYDGTNLTTTGTATATRFIPSGSTVATNGMYLPSANTLGFSTNSTQRMAITSGGVMYLGATLGNNFSFTYGSAVDISGSGTGIAGTGTNLNLGVWNGPMVFQAGNDGTNLQERMRITSAGNVGIGTSSPTGSLEIATSSATSIVANSSNSTGGWIEYKRSGTAYAYIGNAGALTGSNTDDLAIQAIAGKSLRLQTNGNNTRMIIDSSGNVGIGTSSPGAILHTSISGNGEVGRFATTTDNTPYISIYTNGSIRAKLRASSAETGLLSQGATPLLFGTNDTERMRIDSSGNLLVGDTTNSRAASLRVEGDETAYFTGYGNGYGIGLWMTPNPSATGGTADPIKFQNVSNTTVGSISTTASATSYNTSSDYRLKENIVPMTGALATVAQLKPVTYKWKATGENSQGFIAHELQAVVPECVTGEKDAVDVNGKPKYQGIDTSFLVATLTKAIQEQQALIESLTTRLTALENK